MRSICARWQAFGSKPYFVTELHRPIFSAVGLRSYLNKLSGRTVCKSNRLLTFYQRKGFEKYDRTFIARRQF